MTPSTAIVEVRAVSKRFDNVQALQDVSLVVRPGAVTALVGENGAGKSTLGKIISGLYRPDSGQLLVDDHVVDFHAPRDALRLGIATIAQELALAPSRSVLDNVVLGDEPRKWGLIDRGEALRRYQELDEVVGFGIDPFARAGELRVADQQKVEIMRALGRDARVIVLDEPTARLASDEARTLSELVRRLVQGGKTVIYVSHFLQEVLDLADEVAVLKDGRLVRSGPAAAETHDTLVTAMLGRSLEYAFPEVPAVSPDAPTVLAVRGLNRPPEVMSVDLDIRAGEIVGMTGLIGSGRTEFARAVFGADPVSGGSVSLAGEIKTFRHPASAMRKGIAYLPESRADQGLLMGRSIIENVSLPLLRHRARRGLIARRREREDVTSELQRVGVAAPPQAGVLTLSGGNQQKVLWAKWLLGRPKLLLADEPTRGVDVAAKRAIYDLIVRAADEGMAVLLISSEIEEVLGLAHRIVVMRTGGVVAEFTREQATEDLVMRAALAAPSLEEHQ